MVSLMTSKCRLRGSYLQPLILKLRTNYRSLKCNKTVADQLVQLNELFLQSYGLRKADVKKELGVKKPVMILNQDYLILKEKGETVIIKYVPDDYHILKSIAHIACTIQTLQVLDSPKMQNELKEKCLNQIKSLLELVKNDHSPLIVKYLPLLKEYQATLEKKEMQTLLHLEGWLKALLKDAAILRTDSLHKQIKLIQVKMCPEQWKHLAIIVMGPRMPREGELGMQYAKKMILESEDPSLAKLCPHLNGTLTKHGDVMQGKKLIYLESIQDIDKALDELTTEICDEVLGEALLGDKGMMRADFLKNAVQEYLQTLM